MMPLQLPIALSNMQCITEKCIQECCLWYNETNCKRANCSKQTLAPLALCGGYMAQAALGHCNLAASKPHVARKYTSLRHYHGPRCNMHCQP